MKQEATISNSLRRVGAAEGAWHVLGAAAAMTLLGRAFPSEIALLAPVGAGLLWAAWYGLWRAARVRDWFGAWDAVSFGFVAAYAVTIASAAHGIALR